MSEIKILCLGDIVGASGREAVRENLPAHLKSEPVDLVIANAENAAHGFGLNTKIAEEIFACGVDILTGGNHTFDKREVHQAFLTYPDRILRPANYPPETAGRGITIVHSKSGHRVGIVNLMGRVYMDALDCPFQTFRREIAKIRRETSFVIVDFHAEVTSEKLAMGYFVDGQASVCFGTHTHVQTADERILPQGTGFISDLGMNGPAHSIIGMNTEIVLERMVKKLPIKLEVAEGPGVFQGAVFTIDRNSGQCLSIKRLQKWPSK